MKIVDCLEGSLNASRIRRALVVMLCVGLLTGASGAPTSSRAAAAEPEYLLTLKVRGKGDEPSPVAVHEPVAVRVELQPIYPSEVFEGTLDFETSGQVVGLPDHVTFTAEDEGLAIVRGVRFTELGSHEIEVSSEDPRVPRRNSVQRVFASIPGLTVLVANLQEAFEDSDVRDHTDVKRFAPAAARSLEGTRVDVILLQEVRRSSAR